MKLVIISDTHHRHNAVKLPKGDMLIHCGDFSAMGAHKEVKHFFKWFAQRPFEYKILIAGNHDLSFEREPEFKAELVSAYQERITYLEDSGCEIDGVKFWGSPWQPAFGNWAFNLIRNSDEMIHKWSLIPAGTDVLITHGPPHGILDYCTYHYPQLPNNAGCEILYNRIMELKPKLHVFGHIHECYGMKEREGVTFINASICTLSYEPLHAPVEIEI